MADPLTPTFGIDSLAIDAGKAVNPEPAQVPIPTTEQVQDVQSKGLDPMAPQNYTPDKGGPFIQQVQKIVDSIPTDTSFTEKHPILSSFSLFSLVKNWGQSVLDAMQAGAGEKTPNPAELMNIYTPSFVAGHFYPVGSLGVFGSRLTENSGLFQRMQKGLESTDLAVEPASTILKKTGLSKDFNNNWVLEVDDSKARLTSEAGAIANKIDLSNISPQSLSRVDNMQQALNNGTAKLPTVFDHPELYEAFPYLQDLTVKDTGPGESKGAFIARNNTIEVNMSQSPDEIKKTLLHEVQHAVNWQEKQWGVDRPMGTNSDIVTDQYMSMIKVVSKMVKAGNVTPEEASGVKSFMDQVKTNYDLYKANPGEVEARNVEARMHLSAEARQEVLPSATMDLPFSSQMDLAPFDQIYKKMSQQETDAHLDKMLSMTEDQALTKGIKNIDEIPEIEKLWDKDVPVETVNTVPDEFKLIHSASGQEWTIEHKEKTSTGIHPWFDTKADAVAYAQELKNHWMEKSPQTKKLSESLQPKDGMSSSDFLGNEWDVEGNPTVGYEVFMNGEVIGTFEGKNLSEALERGKEYVLKNPAAEVKKKDISLEQTSYNPDDYKQTLHEGNPLVENPNSASSFGSKWGYSKYSTDNGGEIEFMYKDGKPSQAVLWDEEGNYDKQLGPNEVNFPPEPKGSSTWQDLPIKESFENQKDLHAVQVDINGEKSWEVYDSNNKLIGTSPGNKTKEQALSYWNNKQGLETKLHSDWIDYVNNLPEDSKYAIGQYTVSTYREINKMLAGEGDYLDDYHKNRVADYIVQMDHALNNASAPESFVTYRAISSRIAQAFNELEPGDGWVHVPYASTSIDKNIAQGFKEENRTVLEIHGSKGAKAIYVDKISDSAGEKEIIIRRGAVMVIKEKKPNYVVVELMND